MSVEVLIEAFEKAKKDIGSDKKTHLSTHLSDLLQEEYGYTISERRLRDYYTNFNNGISEDQDDLKPKLIECLCKYLGYRNYGDFVSQNPGKKGDVKVRKGKNKYSMKLIGGASLLTVGALTYFGFISEKKECMIWVKDHYERQICYGFENDKLYNELEFEEFRKVEVCDTTTFFRKYKPQIWYDKSNGKVEYFTYYGIHPINGKTLKPITQTIIDNHVRPCDYVEKP